MNNRRAIETAFLTRMTMACEDHVARLEPMSFEDLEKEPIDAYAVTVLYLFDKLGDVLEANKRFPPDRTRCGWCVRAAGGDQAAWDAAPWLSYPDEVVAHALICEHNPPAERLQAAEAKIAALEEERDRAVASAEWWGRATARVMQVGRAAVKFWQDRASEGKGGR